MIKEIKEWENSDKLKSLMDFLEMSPNQIVQAIFLRNRPSHMGPYETALHWYFREIVENQEIVLSELNIAHNRERYCEDLILFIWAATVPPHKELF